MVSLGYAAIYWFGCIKLIGLRKMGTGHANIVVGISLGIDGSFFHVKSWLITKLGRCVELVIVHIGVVLGLVTLG